MNKSEGLSN